MENSSTVRIDMQRLQMLNDRLCQTLEALNQVRLTAHNVAPSAYGMGMGMTPGMYPGFAPQTSFWGAHGFSGYPVNPMGFWGSPVTPGYIPTPGFHSGCATQPYMGGVHTQPYFGGVPATQPYFGGYSHGIDQVRTSPIAHQQPIW